MKKVLSQLLILALLAVAFSACKSPETTAYKATGAVIISVDTAMQIWGDHVKAGKATADQIAKVGSIYNKYLATVKVERTAINAYKTNHDTNVLNQVIGIVAASSSDVIGLVESFLPPETLIKLKGN